jgi:hypothetical protein
MYRLGSRPILNKRLGHYISERSGLSDVANEAYSLCIDYRHSSKLCNGVGCPIFVVKDVYYGCATRT